MRAMTSSISLLVLMARMPMAVEFSVGILSVSPEMGILKT